MKNTILSKKDAIIIEKIVIQFGRIVSTGNLMKVFREEYTESSAHNRIQTLFRAGWLVRIKRGLYLIIENLTSRSISDISLLTIVQSINKDSYISLGSALNYYQMFDQYSKTVVVINYRSSKLYKFERQEIRFAKVSKKYYFGFTQIRHDEKLINIATKEKALLDYLYLDKSFYAANLVFEKIKNYQHEVDFAKLQDYALRSSISIQRKIGLLLDQININSSELLESVKTHKGFSRFTKESKIFNAKWRLYYDDRIIR
jgi:predicted transcriptional regulator of viral defense system